MFARVPCDDVSGRAVVYAAKDNPGKLAVTSSPPPWPGGGVVLAAYHLDYPHPSFEGVYTGLWGEVSCHAGRGKFFAEIVSETPCRGSHPHVEYEFFAEFGAAVTWLERKLDREKALLEHCGFDTELALAGADNYGEENAQVRST